MILSKFKPLLLSLFISVASTPLHAQVFILDDIESSPHAEQEASVQEASAQQAEGKGQVVFSVDKAEQLLSSEFPLQIEAIDARSGDTITVFPGAYDFRPGQYHIRIYRSKPDAMEPLSQYQIIEDTITIAEGDVIQRNYPAPARRQSRAPFYIIALTGGLAMASDSYEVANPTKEHLDSLGTNNTLSETTTLGDTPFSSSTQGSYALTFFHSITDKPLVAQLGFSQTIAGDLQRTRLSAGGGYFKKRGETVDLYTATFGKESASWNSVNLTTALGTTEISASTDNTVLALQWLRTNTNGGLTYSINVDLLNQTAAARIGWNFGKSYSRYDSPAITRFKP